MAAAPKNGIEFCQKSIGAIRCSLATLYDSWRRRATSPLFCNHRPRTHTPVHVEQASPVKNWGQTMFGSQKMPSPKGLSPGQILQGQMSP